MYFFAWIWIQKKIPFLPAVDPLKILAHTGTGILLYTIVMAIIVYGINPWLKK